MRSTFEGTANENTICAVNSVKAGCVYPSDEFHQQDATDGVILCRSRGYPIGTVGLKKATPADIEEAVKKGELIQFATP